MAARQALRSIAIIKESIFENAGLQNLVEKIVYLKPFNKSDG
jgi:hypothetical protein